MKLSEFFNPLDIDHLKAFYHLQTKGTWPPGFIPEEVYQNMEPQWYMLIQAKMADLWVRTNIFMNDISSENTEGLLKDTMKSFKKMLDEQRSHDGRKHDEQSSQSNE